MDQLTTWMESFQEPVKGLGYAIAIISVLVLGIIMITGGQQGLSKGKGMAAGIVAGIAVLSFGVAIVATLQG